MVLSRTSKLASESLHVVFEGGKYSDSLKGLEKLGWLGMNPKTNAKERNWGLALKIRCAYIEDCPAEPT